LIDSGSTTRVQATTSGADVTGTLNVTRSENTNVTGATLANYDNTAGTNQSTRLDFGLARNSGALKPYAGRIQVGKNLDWTSDDANIDAYMSFSTYKNNVLEERMRIDSGAVETKNKAVFGGNSGSGAHVQAIVRNTQLPNSAGATSQTATVDFEMGSSEAGALSYREAARIEAYKVSDWHTGAASTNFTSGLKFYGRNADVLTEHARIDNGGLFYMNSGYGSVAPVYGCRAWLNYGTSVGIRESKGISSVTVQGTGQYVINFSFAFPDTNYILNATSFDGGGQNDIRAVNSSFNAPGKTTTQHQIYCMGMTTGPSNPILDNTDNLMITAYR
jgi:hypothetical protein